ncbi:glutathione S-transferase family protein [soil metagenome]
MSIEPVDPKANGLALYFSPGACSRVSIIALEEAGAEVSLRKVALAENANKSAEYLAINPKGKVPALIVDGRVLTENVAILTYLDSRFPYAKLLPGSTDPLVRSETLSTLAWIASGLHPMVTRIRRATRFCDLPGADKRVPELARVDLAEQLHVAEDRLSKHDWILGDEWSIADAYLHWIWSRATDDQFDKSPFPKLVAFAARMDARPSVVKALEREAA